MMLLTKENLKAFPKLYANENKKPEDIPVIVRLFNPTGAATWYLTEYDPEEELAFGLCVIHEPELGYVSLAELKAFRGRFGLPIERDRHIGKMTLADAMKLEGYPYRGERKSDPETEAAVAAFEA